MVKRRQHHAPMYSLWLFSLMSGTELEELLSHCAFLPPRPNMFSLSSCQPIMTFLPIPPVLPAFLPPLLTPHTSTRVQVKSQVWQCWKSYIKVGNKWKHASSSNMTGPCAQGLTSLPHQFFLLLTMCYDCIAESPTPNDSNSAQSWQK